MNKFSNSSLSIRVFYFIIGFYFIFIYFFLHLLFDWQWRFNLGVIIYFLFAFIFFAIVVKFACLDFDLFLNKDGFIFRNIGNEVFINKDISFQIESVFIGTLFFSTLKIKFTNGEVFYFRYKKFKLSFFNSIDEHAINIENSIRNKLIKLDNSL